MRSPLYTLTQFGTVRGVSIAESGPISRAELEDFTPPVLVESPVAFELSAENGSPIHEMKIPLQPVSLRKTGQYV